MKLNPEEKRISKVKRHAKTVFCLKISLTNENDILISEARKFYDYINMIKLVESEVILDESESVEMYHL